MAALVFFGLGLVAAVYLLLPVESQAWVAGNLAAGSHAVLALDVRHLLVAGTALVCVFLCLMLVFVPSYGGHRYLVTERSIIPPVSVYLDAENQLPAAAVQPFTRFLMKHLDGRRADMLYFLDASQAAKSPQYRLLYRVGFRPVDVPHNPTGAGTVKEAVDRELAMHAYERALRGPAGQEFILVTGDGDYVPLIYRLAALGHRVQVWGTPIHRAYAELATYLIGVNALDLALVLSELQVVASDPVIGRAESAESERHGVPVRQRRAGRRHRLGPAAHIGPPVGLTDPGEEQIYQAIAETRVAHARCQGLPGAERARSNVFRGILGGELAPRLASVGYGAGSWIDYWLDHLAALRVFTTAPGHTYPVEGPATSEDAARALFATFHAAARATGEATLNDDGTISMSAVARALASEPWDDGAEALRRMLERSGNRASVHARYFVRGARALGLIRFEDTRRSLDTIRLISPGRDDAPEVGGRGSGSEAGQTEASAAAEGSKLPTTASQTPTS